MRFKNKSAIVCGAGGGIGLNLANDLLNEGANVSLVDLKPRPDNISEGTGQAQYHQGDVTNEAFVSEFTRDTVSAFGGLDCLVNATGVLWFDRDMSVVDVDMETWDRVMEINLKSFALTSRHAVPAMRRSGGGALVHIASIDALRGDSQPQDAYGASKAAVIRLSKSLAIQFAGDGIRSNTVLPGPVLSPMQARWEGSAEAFAAVQQTVPLGRVGHTQDISNACLFLLSDKASFITGTDLVVDGGCLAKL
jgi:3-oxoacyl-[acyl-carrier protein] reductase